MRKGIQSGSDDYLSRVIRTNVSWQTSPQIRRHARFMRGCFYIILKRSNPLTPGWEGPTWVGRSQPWSIPSPGRRLSMGWKRAGGLSPIPRVLGLRTILREGNIFNSCISFHRPSLLKKVFSLENGGLLKDGRDIYNHLITRTCLYKNFIS